MEDTLASEFGTLSLNALSGTDEGEAIKIRALLKNKVMLILVDSGSSHSFVSSSLLAQVGIQPLPMQPKLIRVANGETLVCASFVPQLAWWTQGHTMHSDMLVLDLGGYDAILGFDWLKTHSPMHCHWANRTITFLHQGRLINLQGVQPPELELPELKADQLVKWAAGNDIGAFAIVEVVKDTTVPSMAPQVQTLLEEYKDVFEDPQTLPPERLLDHSIPLLPNATTVNSAQG
jgi:hypothetical protein